MPRAPRRASKLALALAAFAGLRVWAFAFAFPFFTNVDEYRHVDAVLKYARGASPAVGAVAYEPETARLLGVVASPEYHRDAADPARPELPPPTWRAGTEVAAERIARMERFLRDRNSLEAGQPPTYYALAGAWLALGRSLGLRDAALLYWVRWLAVPAAFALVLASALVLRQLYPTSPLVYAGVPLLVAAMPQDALYYVTGDALSPLLGGIGFLGAARLLAAGGARARSYAWVGLALAAAVLCKYPNGAVVLGVGGVALAALRGADAPARRRWALLAATAVLPPLLWALRNLALGGGLTGSAFKAAQLGWTPKPVAAWLDHPLFTPPGLGVFLHDLAASFWRGELVWYQQPLVSGAADAVYVAFTAVALLVLAFCAARGRVPRGLGRVDAAAALSVLAAVLLLAWLSVSYEFGATVHPSPEYPYFSNGRLVGGVLVPLCLLLVRGVECAVAPLPPVLRQRAGWALLGGVCAVALASEVALSLPVFASAYNAYHLP